jgi:hypothetical protein
MKHCHVGKELLKKQKAHEELPKLDWIVITVEFELLLTWTFTFLQIPSHTCQFLHLPFQVSLQHIAVLIFSNNYFSPTFF